MKIDLLYSNVGVSGHATTRALAHLAQLDKTCLDTRSWYKDKIEITTHTLDLDLGQAQTGQAEFGAVKYLACEQTAETSYPATVLGLLIALIFCFFLHLRNLF